MFVTLVKLLLSLSCDYSRPDGRVDLRVNAPLGPEPWVISAMSFSRDHGLAFNDIPNRVSFLETEVYVSDFVVDFSQPQPSLTGKQDGAQNEVFDGRLSQQFISRFERHPRCNRTRSMTMVHYNCWPLVV